MNERFQLAFRSSTLFFAAFLALQAVWLLAAEIIRPSVPRFPTDKATLAAMASQRTAAGLAAEIGVLRGDLWASYALTLQAGLLAEAKIAKPRGSVDVSEYGREAAMTAVELAPTDARIWLLLALIDQRLDRLGRRTLGPLKMSYYTDPNDAAIIPTRLLIATRSPAIADPELKELVSREIRTIVTRRPDLKSALLDAYRGALPEGRQLIDSRVAELNQNLATEIRASVASQENIYRPSGNIQQSAGAVGTAGEPTSDERIPRQ
jgi:hypothetical protein